LTIGCIPVPLEESKLFGVVQSDRDARVTGFVEKPALTDPMPGDPNHFLASMGIYIFTTEKLFNLLIDDAADPNSSHDFGKNIIPAMIAMSKVCAFRFRDRNKKATPYWRDVGTLDAYFLANMDLIEVEPVLNLYDADWPIRTAIRNLPPPKFVHDDKVDGQVRRGEAVECIVCAGSIVSGARVRRSVVAQHVRVNSFAQVDESILFDGVNVGRRCKIRRAIIDKHVHIPEGMTIGYNRQADEALGLTFSDNGVVLVPKGHAFEKK
jgi:glucose-1-phosphate adenylyltransferase